MVLDGLSNMLKMAGDGAMDVANLIEECGGLDRIEALQSHEKNEIYKMAYDIIEQYFADEVSETTPSVILLILADSLADPWLRTALTDFNPVYVTERPCQTFLRCTKYVITHITFRNSGK